MKNMKIAILDFDDIKNPLLNGGQARATNEVAKRLVKKGHKVEVISSKYPGFEDRIEEGINYRHIGFGSGNIRLNNILYILMIPFAVRAIKADMILECFTAPISTLFSPVFTDIPVAALPTSFDAERFSKLYHLPFDRIERFGCRFYKYFLPFTEHLSEKIKKINPSVITKVVPEGVGKEFFKIEKKTVKHILFLGRLDMDQKGIDLLLRSYSKIASEVDLPLVIAGNGPDEERIRSYISELHLEKKVSMAGAAYGEKKARLLSEALFVAFPSRNEGFSLFALEALASGLPLVAFDIPGLSWNNSSVAMKAKAFDVDEYSLLLRKAVQDENLTSKMSVDARSFAMNFTWDKVADQFESFFHEIIEKEKLKTINS